MISTRPQDWTAEEKLAVVIEAAALSDEELGGFLRRRGIHEAQLKEWRQMVLSGLEKPPSRFSKTFSAEARRIRELERELARKEKALAEAAALLVLKKKAQTIWGDEDESTARRNGSEF
jgi:transposase-like protein